MAFKRLSNLFGPKKSIVKATEEYQKWREMIFSVPPEEVGVSKSDANRVYGVIMDIGKLDTQTSTHWAISLDAFSTGEASFHATPGSSVIGLGEDAKVAQAAQEIVQFAQGLLPETNPTQDLSLPEPGIVQFFFLATDGLHVVKGHLDQFQKRGNPFLQLIQRFHFIHQFADQVSEERHKPNIKALYVAAFTPEELNREKLIPLVFFAIDRLKAINPTFNRRIEQMPAKTPIEMSSLKHFPKVHTLTSMQTSMKVVLKKHNVALNPTAEDNFFVHGMTDPQGKENIFLFYFDMAW
jgi:hypothetical protein